MASLEFYGLDENGNLVKKTIGGDTELSLTGSCVLATSNTAPPGTLIADGSEVSRQAYDKLFEKIGTAYGDGDGKETFNVPDWRGLAQRRCLPPDIKMPETKLYITYHEHTE